MQVSHPLDVFVTNDTDRQILNIFVDEMAKVSPRKRKTATAIAVNLLRQKESTKFPHALAHAITSVEKAEQQN
jgi:hypothetical protein